MMAAPVGFSTLENALDPAKFKEPRFSQCPGLPFSVHIQCSKPISLTASSFGDIVAVDTGFGNRLRRQIVIAKDPAAELFRRDPSDATTMYQSLS